ncbi:MULTISPECIES: V-type ATP synthase subunit D [Kitasatospora]|uniref:V-type ATPase, D subunit n=1 Tax=Kitasatospora cathayae TaxID=3004092 RepID=A0ABY7PW60_9ACTN|nr:V-type ATP synthase subunit D [Kitasatospora sp. HUAS 3-15]WBP84633.1 V-type ATPase, D subunit [Kitasatospora sp. HUAS 3-15]
MTSRRHAPPGRAARLRLRHSLDVALRGADLLDRKLRVLLERHGQLRQDEETAEARWRERLAEAETWLLRGLLVSGEGALAAAAVADRADVVVEWTVSMGVHHPSGVSCTDAVRAAHEPAPGNTALVHAEAAYREAVRAAAAYAAHRTAARLVGEETARTRRRVRALRRHWIPRLTAELAAVEQAVEQAEHEDAVRRRWAADRTRGQA